MTVRTYASTDTDAPILTGQTGSLNDLLHAILVAGYGTIDPLGWTREFNDAASKTMVWRPAAGPRHHLQSNDNGPGAGTYKEARWRGYVTMSAYNAGTEPFPTAAQSANGLFVRKSAAADATPRAWRAVGDESTLYLFIHAGDATDNYRPFIFGAFASWKPADAYASIIAANAVENTTSITATQCPQAYVDTLTTTTTAAYAPRSYTGIGTSAALSFDLNNALTQENAFNPWGSFGQPYPFPVDGGILLSPLYLSEATTPRGTARGLWIPAHARPLLQDDTFTAADGAVTRTLKAQHILTTGQCLLETSNTWDA